MHTIIKHKAYGLILALLSIRNDVVGSANESCFTSFLNLLIRQIFCGVCRSVANILIELKDAQRFTGLTLSKYSGLAEQLSKS